MPDTASAGPSITVSVVITAPADAVWETVEPIERHVDWMVDAHAITFDGAQTRGVGTRFTCDTRIGPIRLADRMEITEWIPGERMGVRHTGVVTGLGAFTIEPIDGGERTRFTWTETLSFPWWLGGRLGAAVGGRCVLAPMWRRNLRALARLIHAT